MIKITMICKFAFDDKSTILSSCDCTLILELYCLHSRTNLFPVFKFDG